MIEQGFNYAVFIVKEMTDIFDSRVENLEPKEEKKKSSAAVKKSKDKKSTKKRKREDSDSSVVESSNDSSVDHGTTKKCCIIHNQCSHFMDICKDLLAMVNKHKQRKKSSNCTERTKKN